MKALITRLNRGFNLALSPPSSDAKTKGFSNDRYSGMTYDGADEKQWTMR